MLLFFAGMLAADTLVMKDGTQHVGTLVSTSATTVTFRENGVLHHYRKSSVQSIDMATSDNSSPTLGTRSREKAALPKNFDLASGTEIAVMTNQAIDSANASPGQTFSADVAENVMDSAGHVAIPKGSPAELVLRNVSKGGVTSGSEVTLDLQSVKVGSQRYNVNTADLQQKGRDGVGANKRTAEMVGGGTVLGTLVGAIAGGGKGAAIGALAGAGAGAGTQILTRGKSVKVPAETTLRFRLDQPMEMSAAY